MPTTVIGSTHLPTLLDQIKRTDPDGSISQIAEVLQQRNPILMDAVAMPGNLATGHRHTIRSGLPAVGWRLLNQGISASKSQTIQVDETCGLLEGRSEVDCEIARLNGNEAEFRASEDRAFLQSLNHEAAYSIFYASTKADPEKIHGLSPRFAQYANAGNSENVIAGGGASTDNASIWFVTWGPDTCFLLYPRGTVGGLQQEDLGKDYVEEPHGTSAVPTGRKFLAYRTHFIWRLGLCVKDWRYIVRICNIDKSDLSATGTNLINLMVEAYNRIYDPNMGRLVIYMSRALSCRLDQQVMNKSNVWLGIDEWHGKKITTFHGAPIVTCDALAADETLVVA